MAGPWLKMECATPDKPEVLAITAALGWDDPDLTVGKLFKLWRWFDQHTTDGNASGVTPALLDRVVGVGGFVQAVAKVDWLSISEAGISLLNFDRHNGETAKGRAETAQRVAKHRAKKPSEVNVGNAERSCIPRPIRRKVFECFGHKCVYCGRPEGQYTPPEVAADAVLCIDHVIPLTQGGADDESNFVPACRVCNMFKADRTPEQCGLDWPVGEDGERIGNTIDVTKSVPRGRGRDKEPPTPKGEPEGFTAFWVGWPKNDRKQARGKCLAAWTKGRCELVATDILRHVEHLKRSHSWLKDNGQFIPAPLVYLNGRRWEGAETEATQSGLQLVGGV